MSTNQHQPFYFKQLNTPLSLQNSVIVFQTLEMQAQPYQIKGSGHVNYAERSLLSLLDIINTNNRRQEIIKISGPFQSLKYQKKTIQ